MIFNGGGCGHSRVPAAAPARFVDDAIGISYDADPLDVTLLVQEGHHRLTRRLRVTCGHQANSARYSWRNSASGRGGWPVICWKVPVV